MGRLDIFPVIAAMTLLGGCYNSTDILGDPDVIFDVPTDRVDTWRPDTTPPDLPDVPDVPDVPPDCVDSDGDGVCDSVDRCHGFDDRMDEDGDGVPDGCDCTTVGLVCDPHATCVESDGPPVCVCLPGYEGDGFFCTDIDECATGTAGCDPHATCTNTSGSFRCTCDDGWEGDGFWCIPIDHCAAGTDLCDPHATCTFTGPGTYDCTCIPGYTGDGFTCTPDSGGTTGTVRRMDGTWIPIQYVTCGSGSPGACIADVAKSSCTATGQKVVSHASDGTSEVYDLGATASCYWDTSYFTVDVGMPSTACLVGISNLEWSGCCTTVRWHGNTIAFGAVDEIFGHVRSGDSGYVATYPNLSGFQWGCVEESIAASNPLGCSTQYVACTR